MKNLLTFLSVVFLLFLFIESNVAQVEDHKLLLVNIYFERPHELNTLADLDIDFGRAIIDNYVQVEVNQSQLERIQQRGFRTEIVPMVNGNYFADPEYHTYEEIWNTMDSLSNAYPDITRLDTIGVSQFQNYLIPAIKISDNPELEEDELAILYDGIHHGREPQGMEVCMALTEYLLSNYGSDSLITSWVDNIEIFIVPMLNPDSWKYVVDDSLTNPWWMKNQCDNDTNGVFNPNYDGVDLNRNYDFNWALGGSIYPWHDRYRGTHPFSESESAAKRNLALEQKFLLSITYHSYGEWVGVTTNYSGYPPPDTLLIVEIADSISKRIPKFYGGHYTRKPVRCDGGYSDCWMYAVNGDLEFTVEVATEWMSSGQNALQVAQDNIPGALYLLERVKRGPGITGRITVEENPITGDPIPARVKILELELPHHEGIIEPRMSDSLYGRYYRLLQPGTYTVEVSGEAFDTLFHDVVVAEEGWTYLDIVVGVEEKQIALLDDYYLGQNYPNPFNPTTTINYQIPELSFVTLKVYDVLGSEIATLVNEEKPAGRYEVEFSAIGGSASGGDAWNLPSGIYFYRIQVGNYVSTKKMILLK